MLEGDKSNSRNLPALSLEFGFMIALPLISLGYVGKWLDAKFGTGYFVFIGILVALALTVTWFYKRISSYMPPKK